VGQSPCRRAMPPVGLRHERGRDLAPYSKLPVPLLATPIKSISGGTSATVGFRGGITARSAMSLNASDVGAAGTDPGAASGAGDCSWCSCICCCISCSCCCICCICGCRCCACTCGGKYWPSGRGGGWSGGCCSGTCWREACTTEGRQLCCDDGGGCAFMSGVAWRPSVAAAGGRGW